ncbi:hypothetical protein A2Z10_03025 [Candidatus Azambacteria bacterium RBG_16_47_10]|uniref:Ada DNA repair metal-binding domain-containing protein n=1 Tax=Candidatus Azambacteria bacterium RBG_16_47_10 TaxID=1797292 RepID=A0A1F5B0Q2_9BACT|nr:MAG: hypothetical protein A2Z10_03025 [Candidatus Azambacteria bacterium RBG_16_47_10]
MQLLYNTQEEGGKSIPARIWEYIRDRKSILFRCIELALIAAIFFGLGMVYAFDIAPKKAPVRVIEPQAHEPTAFVAGAIPTQPPAKTAPPAVKKGGYVASKNGSKYYLVTCKNTIKEANKIYFATEEDAKKAGFTPSATCFK